MSVQLLVSHELLGSNCCNQGNFTQNPPMGES
jgi:hypothetical protein